MVDLDLDVCRLRADGSVHLLDEDEFVEHRARYGFPAHVVDEAERQRLDPTGRPGTWSAQGGGPGGRCPGGG
jgi:hypothetical protein